MSPTPPSHARLPLSAHGVETCGAAAQMQQTRTWTTERAARRAAAACFYCTMHAHTLSQGRTLPVLGSTVVRSKHRSPARGERHVHACMRACCQRRECVGGGAGGVQVWRGS